MKFPKDTGKSLRQLTKEKLAKTPKARSPASVTSIKAFIHPEAPGCIPQIRGDTLAPVKLTINNKIEYFLWHTDNTELHTEFFFALQMLHDLNLGLPKNQLLDTAYKCSLTIREQVQQYRETSGAVHSMQGMHGEHLVPLQFKGQGFQWDLNCPENSPEMFSKLLCQDMSLPMSEFPNIAVKLRLALRTHKLRLTNAFNEAVDKVPLVRMHGKTHTLDSLEIENSLQETIPNLTFREHK